MVERLAGRRILVVGAGTRSSDDPDAPMGNGRAISVLAAREGAAVACADRDEHAARETARLIEESAASAGLGRHVALEGARRGIGANVVAPGLIDTPLGRRATQGRPSRTRAPVPLGRQATAWEVAAPVVFLLSDDASYITGQVLAVD